MLSLYTIKVLKKLIQIKLIFLLKYFPCCYAQYVASLLHFLNFVENDVCTFSPPILFGLGVITSTPPQSCLAMLEVSKYVIYAFLTEF